MNEKCKSTINKVKSLIQKEKNELAQNIEPQVQELQGAVLLQFFKHWVKDVNLSESQKDNEFEFLHKPINILNGDISNNMKFCYNGFEEKINEFVIENDEMLIMLDGCAEIYNHTTDEDIIINPFTSCLFKKGDIVDFKTTCKNNYYILISLA